MRLDRSNSTYGECAPPRGGRRRACAATHGGAPPSPPHLQFRCMYVLSCTCSRCDHTAGRHVWLNAAREAKKQEHPPSFHTRQGSGRACGTRLPRETNMGTWGSGSPGLAGQIPSSVHDPKHRYRYPMFVYSDTGPYRYVYHAGVDWGLWGYPTPLGSGKDQCHHAIASRGAELSHEWQGQDLSKVDPQQRHVPTVVRTSSTFAILLASAGYFKFT